LTVGGLAWHFHYIDAIDAMPRVILISGPVGAGKSAVARKLVSLLPASVSYIEGDTFWFFIKKTETQDPRKNFHVIMRSMTAAAIPFARSGYDVVLDFSVPPHFLETARKILKEVPLEYVILYPSEAVCAARAAARTEGAIPDYSKYAGLYALFDGFDQHKINNETADAEVVAAQILEGLNSGRFRVL
jgi:predicted kinase